MQDVGTPSRMDQYFFLNILANFESIVKFVNVCLNRPNYILPRKFHTTSLLITQPRIHLAIVPLHAFIQDQCGQVVRLH
jgi:hypothetical protein